MTPRATLKKLIAARNESDPDIRDRLLGEAFAEYGVFVDHTQQEVRGRAALRRLIGSELLDPDHWVELRGPVSPIGSRHVFRWRIRSSSSASKDELCWMELDESGRIARLTVRNRADTAPLAGQQVLGWAREHPAPTVAAAAGILYAVLHLSLAIFYNRLGMTPEDAGFANEELLRQCLTLLGGLLLVSSVLTVVNFIVFPPGIRLFFVARRLKLEHADGDRALVLAAALVPFGLAFLVMVGAIRREDVSLALIAFGAFLLCFVVVPRVALLLPAARRAIPLADEAAKRSRNLPQQAVLSFMVGGVAGLLLITLPLIARDTANQVRDGEIAGGRLFPWRALPATVTWTSAKREPALDFSNQCSELRFLGEDDSHVFLYAWRSERTLRIPAADVVVSTDDC